MAYLAGESLARIGEADGVCAQTVSDYVKRAGVFTRRGEEAIRKEKVRLEAFDDLTDCDAAYWLGLLYADGSMTQAAKTRAFTVSLVAHRDDEESITGFLQFLGLTGPLHRRADKLATQTRVTSKALCAQLRRLGVVPRKTFTIAYPDWLPPSSHRHFVRGFFDGDGCIRFARKARYVTPQGVCSIVSNERFIRGLAARVQAECGVALTTLSAHRRSYRVTYEGRNKLLSLSNWLYAAGGPALSRKRFTWLKGLER